MASPSKSLCTLACVFLASHLVYGQLSATIAPASNIAYGWATLNGSANPGGQSAYAYFIYGQTANPYDHQYSGYIDLGSGSSPVPVSLNVAYLARGTSYHFYMVVNNGSGAVTSSEQTFTTPETTIPPMWRSIQVTGLNSTPYISNQMADGARTGATHSSGQAYFYRGMDNNLWIVYWTGGVWEHSGGVWTQEKLTTSTNVADWLAWGTKYGLLCYQGTDGKLWCVYYDSTWSRWLMVQLGEPPSSITVAGDVVIDSGWNIIYYRGSDSKVYAVQWNGSQWVHTGLGGTANVKGNLAVDPNYHLVYYQGTDNQMWCEQWTGKVWQQVQLTTTANVAASVAVDHIGLLTYYRSSTDNSGWTVYWNGNAWVQKQLDETANMNSTASSSSGIAPFPVNYDTLYLDNAGQCRAMHWNGSQWSDLILADGGQGLTGGLSVQPTYGMAFARRSDGNIVLFYYQ
jgi:hypothetical protein